MKPSPVLKRRRQRRNRNKDCRKIANQSNQSRIVKSWIIKRGRRIPLPNAKKEKDRSTKCFNTLNENILNSINFFGFSLISISFQKKFLYSSLISFPCCIGKNGVSVIHKLPDLRRQGVAVFLAFPIILDRKFRENQNS